MPRVLADKKKYKIRDLTKYIAGEMYIKNISQQTMADELGISQPAFCNRLKHHSFKYIDLVVILQKLGSSDEDILKLMKM